MHSRHSGSFALCLQHVSVEEMMERFFASHERKQEFCRLLEAYARAQYNKFRDVIMTSNGGQNKKIKGPVGRSSSSFRKAMNDRLGGPAGHCCNGWRHWRSQ